GPLELARALEEGLGVRAQIELGIDRDAQARQGRIVVVDHLHLRPFFARAADRRKEKFAAPPQLPRALRLAALALQRRREPRGLLRLAADQSLERRSKVPEGEVPQQSIGVRRGEIRSRGEPGGVQAPAELERKGRREERSGRKVVALLDRLD